jgi:hypothetical protein
LSTACRRQHLHTLTMRLLSIESAGPTTCRPEPQRSAEPLAVQLRLSQHVPRWRSGHRCPCGYAACYLGFSMQVLALAATSTLPCSAQYALVGRVIEVKNMPLHADRITPLGKLPIIASLSVGATRVFRVKRAGAAHEDADADTTPGRAPAEAAEVCLLSVATSLTGSLPGCDKGTAKSVCVPNFTWIAQWKQWWISPAHRLRRPTGRCIAVSGGRACKLCASAPEAQHTYMTGWLT